MPLVVPGITSTDGSKTQEWQNKLVGKTISDTETNATMFCKTELPEKHRIVEPGGIMTRDYHEDRLNVFVDKDGTVTHVTHG
ncbi:hypothetical protein CDD82_2942 [Ophiocordyceps australis]|uniref:Proteinase inhibitor I78 n=1 Tax=Ophiocordyceps australis TaxID=1399860 RepID=A0A2C5XSX4_9HYPO|nr:hypothetical protein CDD82_2942 [Ophiocordyceps australis]